MTHYDDALMLNPRQNVMAAKGCEEYPDGLLRAIDLLFRKKGAALVEASLLEHLSIMKAVTWIAKNIESHTVALRALIDADEWSKIE